MSGTRNPKTKLEATFQAGTEKFPPGLITWARPVLRSRRLCTKKPVCGAYGAVLYRDHYPGLRTCELESGIIPLEKEGWMRDQENIAKQP